MGYTRFSLKNFSQPFRPVEAPDLRLRSEGHDCSSGELNLPSVFLQGIVAEPCPVGRANTKATRTSERATASDPSEGAPAQP